jgi:hypothetical protein
MLFWLIEDNEQLSKFLSQNHKEVFIELILENDNIHPSLNKLSLIYIRPLLASKGYIATISHNETLSCNITNINALLQTYDKMYVRDKKQFMYFFPNRNVIDINFIENIEDESRTNVHEYFYSKFPDNEKINKIIPVTKHYERCENLWKKVKPIINKPIPDYFNFYNKNITNVFWFIEQEGIRINPNIIEDKFNIINKKFSIKDNKIYSKYNLYNSTSRPSNSFNGVNFSALNKENGQRKALIPENDFLLEIDINAYHPTLASHLVNYDFKDLNPYEYLADKTKLSIPESKEKMFEVLYGGKFEGLEGLEFFDKLKIYIELLWEDYKKDGFIEEKISGYKFYKNKLDKMNPYKLFNYLLQCKETSQNVVIMKKILTLLKNKKSKLILYVYDSFCFDMDENEKDLIEEIIKIFSNYNLKVKTKMGVSYEF